MYYTSFSSSSSLQSHIFLLFNSALGLLAVVPLLCLLFLSETYADLATGLSMNQDGGIKLHYYSCFTMYLQYLKGGGEPALIKNTFDKAVKIINFIKS